MRPQLSPLLLVSALLGTFAQFGSTGMPCLADSPSAVTPAASAADKTTTTDKPADPAVDEPVPELTEEKKALIKELLKEMDADKNVGTIIDALLTAQKREYPRILKQFVDADTTLTPVQRADITAHMEERSNKALNRMKQLFDQNINMPQVMEQVAYNVYNKHFTTSELKDIIAYYGTPTGKKSLKLMPKIMEESMDQTRQLITPQISKCVSQFVEEERNNLHAPIMTTK